MQSRLGFKKLFIVLKKNWLTFCKLIWVVIVSTWHSFSPEFYSPCRFLWPDKFLTGITGFSALEWASDCLTWGAEPSASPTTTCLFFLPRYFLYLAHTASWLRTLTLPSCLKLVLQMTSCVVVRDLTPWILLPPSNTGLLYNAYRVMMIQSNHTICLVPCLG